MPMKHHQTMRHWSSYEAAKENACIQEQDHHRSCKGCRSWRSFSHGAEKLQDATLEMLGTLHLHALWFLLPASTPFDFPPLSATRPNIIQWLVIFINITESLLTILSNTMSFLHIKIIQNIAATRRGTFGLWGHIHPIWKKISNSTKSQKFLKIFLK